MRLNKTYKKLNNGGFSLIEVLVGIIILSIVTIPLLTAFILSTKLNNKARNTQQMTAIAQNYMEVFKSTNIESVIMSGQFDAIDTIPTGHIPAREYPYMLVKHGLVVDGKTYDIKVTASPRKYLESDTDVMFDLKKPIPSNAYADVVMILPIETDEAAYNSFKQQALDVINANNNNVLPDGSLFYEFTTDIVDMDYVDIERYIEVEIWPEPANISNPEATPVTMNTQTKIIGNVKYTGRMESYPVEDVNNPGTYTYVTANLTDIIPDKDDALGQDKILSTKLENLHFFYYPGYEDGRLKIKKDHLSFVSKYGGNASETKERNFNLIIFKQKDPLIDDISLTTCEGTYEPDFSYTLPHAWTTYHNFRTNLGNKSTPAGTWADSIFEHNHITTDKMPLIHDIKIEIYNAGEADAVPAVLPLYTLTGTMDSYR